MTSSAEPQLQFPGGGSLSALPMVFFIGWAITICVSGAPDENGLILGAVLGLALGMFVCRSRWSDYAEHVISGMADRVAAVTIVAWFWAGMFAQVLREGGLVDGLVWLGDAIGADGGAFVGVTFLLAAVFASAVGTGYGTVVAFATLMYPAGLLMGADPVWLFAALLSGAAFGDNLAPVSDTTVVSATTQQTDIAGVVRSRLKYALLAAVPALILFIILGGGDSGATALADSPAIASTVSPTPLLLLLPFILVIALAMNGFHIMVTLTWGILAAIAIGLLSGLIEPSQVVSIDADQGVLTGALVSGLAGYLSLAILILLIVACGNIMRVGGAMDQLVDRLSAMAGKSVARCEVVIWGIVASLNVFITINTAAEIAAAPVVSRLGRKFRLHPYRRANMLDAMTSALGYIFPWGGGVLIGHQTIRNLAESSPSIVVVTPTEVWPYVLHGWFLAAVMLFAAITGFGRSFESPESPAEQVAP
jgi:Na+/H+ antiporter NhaC